MKTPYALRASMMRLTRPPIPFQTLQQLAELTRRVASANDPKAEANRLWRGPARKVIQQTKLAFIAASPGLGACAYCEAGAASVLDHWRPRSQYPHLCFDILNLIPTCRDCNEGSKRAKFPLDFGGSPLLLDPFQDDPLDHIELNLANGAYAAVTPRGHTTIRTFKLDRTSLRTARLDAVRHAQRRLIDYYHARQGNHIADANLIEGELARMQHESVLAYLTRASQTRSPPKGFHPDVAFALRTYPQVQRF